MPFARARQKGMGKNMKLRIRYENECQVIELDEKAANRLWVSLSLTGGEDMTKEEKEQRIQEAWHEHFNKSDYNCFHKFDRHRGNSKAQLNVDADNLDISEPLMDEVLDSRIFCKESIERESQWEYEATCLKVREVLKPSAADMVVAIALDGQTVAEYAASIGDEANNVSHRYRRAIKTLKKVFSKTFFLLFSQGY